MTYYMCYTMICLTMQKDTSQEKLEKAGQKCNLNIFSDGTHKLFAKNQKPDLVASF